MFTKKNYSLLSLFFLLLVFTAFPYYSAEASGTITGITPSGNYNTVTGGRSQVDNPEIFNSKSYGANSRVNLNSPFKWWGYSLNLSPFVSQNYSNPISQIDNISTTITGINNQSVTVPLNYSLNNSNFNGRGFALRYYSFNHVISVGNFLPAPISWILFFISSIKDKYYYSSSNFNLSYVSSSNLTMHTTDAVITGKMQELFLRYYWNPIGVDYPISIDNHDITLVPYVNLGVGGFTDFFYAHDFNSNNSQDLLYVALTNPQAANNEYAQGLYGLGLRYGVGVQIFAKKFVGQISFHVLPYDFKRGFAAPGFLATTKASLPSPSMAERVFDIGANYNFASHWYAGLNYENDSFHVGSIGQTPVNLSNVNITGSGSGTVSADSFYNGGTMTNNYLYLTIGYEF